MNPIVEILHFQIV